MSLYAQNRHFEPLSLAQAAILLDSCQRKMGLGAAHADEARAALLAQRRLGLGAVVGERPAASGGNEGLTQGTARSAACLTRRWFRGLVVRSRAVAGRGVLLWGQA